MAVFLFVLYMLPSIVALFTRRRQAATLLVNLLFGWTIIGWLVALGMAVVDSKAQRIVNLEEQVKAERAERAARKRRLA